MLLEKLADAALFRRGTNRAVALFARCTRAGLSQRDNPTNNSLSALHSISIVNNILHASTEYD